MFAIVFLLLPIGFAIVVVNFPLSLFRISSYSSYFAMMDISGCRVESCMIEPGLVSENVYYVQVDSAGYR